jgi:outer membrane receptor protein involved in Fe transport
MIANCRRPSTVSGVVLASLTMAWPLGGRAQIEEITVTARKREESLQEVPLSVSAFSGEQLQQQGLGSDFDVADFTVNFNTLAQTGRDTDRPVIRGMAAPPSRGDANASYFIDGIFVAGSIAAATTGAVDRVEILRGPQSTQFGRATFAGAVNYVTRSPGNALKGQINTKAGTHDDYVVGGWVTGPIIEDKLLFLVSGNWSSYGGQWHNNLQPDSAITSTPSGLIDPTNAYLVNPPQQGDHSRLGAEETTDALFKLNWVPVEGTTFSFKYGYTEGDDSHFPSLVAPGDLRQQLNCWLPPTLPSQGGPVGPITSGGAFCGTFDPTGWENRINLPDMREGVTTTTGYYAPPVEPGTRRTQNRYLLDYTQELGDWTLIARGAYNEDDFNQGFDLDHQQVRALFGLFEFHLDRYTEDTAAEIRLQTPQDGPVRAQLGLYWFDTSRETRTRSFTGIGPFLNPQSPVFPPATQRDVRNTAVFGGLDWDLAEQWTLSLEARYGQDDLDLTGGNGESDSDSFDAFTPRITLRYQPTDDLNLYALAAKGNKPGDFNTEYFRGDICAAATQREAALGNTVVKEEEQWTYEFGAKSIWLDRRLQVNLAAYYIDWTNQSLFTTVTFDNCGTAFTTTVLRNAGQSEVIGGELETTFVLNDRLTLIANYGYADAEFVEGCDTLLATVTGVGLAPDPEQRGKLTPCPASNPQNNLSGKTIPSAPEHNAVLGAIVTSPINDELTLTLRSDVVLESERESQPGNFGHIPNRTLVNLRAGVSNAQWTVTAYVRNLMDDDTPLAALNFLDFANSPITTGLDNVSGTSDDVYANIWSLNPQRGRDWGVEIQYSFGSY